MSVPLHFHPIAETSKQWLNPGLLPRPLRSLEKSSRIIGRPKFSSPHVCRRWLNRMDHFTETCGASRHNEKTSAFDDAVASSKPGASQQSTDASVLVADESRMDEYFKVISLVERLHRQFLGLVKLELDRLGIHDINNVQGMMLFSIGGAEMTVG